MALQFGPHAGGIRALPKTLVNPKLPTMSTFGPNSKPTHQRQVASAGDKLQQDLHNEDDDNDAIPHRKHHVAGGVDTAAT